MLRIKNNLKALMIRKKNTVSIKNRTHSKKMYRFIDNYRTNVINALILDKFVKDPNRTGFLSLIMTLNGILSYILAANYPKEQTKVSNL